MAEGCFERFNLEFIVWVWTYPERSRKRVMSDLAAAHDQRVILLKSKGEIERFLKDPYANQAG